MVEIMYQFLSIHREEGEEYPSIMWVMEFHQLLTMIQGYDSIVTKKGNSEMCEVGTLSLPTSNQDNTLKKPIESPTKMVTIVL